jgi:uncharacterized protein YndB with AHSA1/START domain
MSAAETLRVVDAYHQAWTTKRFSEAVSLLAPLLQVEVPINNYATPGSFSEALIRFGSEVVTVEVLSRMVSDDEAMILYDMNVRNLGVIRIVEHFTVADGKIVRLRQIHDTTPTRAIDFDQETSGNRQHELAGALGGDGYHAEIAIEAPYRHVFEALTSFEGLVGWWASSATGSLSPGTQFELGFAGLEETITWEVEALAAPYSVAWTCLSHTGLPDWDGTKIVFELSAHETELTVVKFRHIGLVPELDCYGQCSAGWEHFLSSLKSFAERGQGTPFTEQPY